MGDRHCHHRRLRRHLPCHRCRPSGRRLADVRRHRCAWRVHRLHRRLSHQVRSPRRPAGQGHARPRGNLRPRLDRCAAGPGVPARRLHGAGHREGRGQLAYRRSPRGGCRGADGGCLADGGVAPGAGRPCRAHRDRHRRRCDQRGDCRRRASPGARLDGQRVVLGADRRPGTLVRPARLGRRHAGPRTARVLQCGRTRRPRPARPPLPLRGRGRRGPHSASRPHRRFRCARTAPDRAHGAAVAGRGRRSQASVTDCPRRCQRRPRHRGPVSPSPRTAHARRSLGPCDGPAVDDLPARCVPVRRCGPLRGDPRLRLRRRGRAGNLHRAAAAESPAAVRCARDGADKPRSGTFGPTARRRQ